MGGDYWMMSQPIVRAGVKTNLITGFLGAGKTTCIQQLLRQKPPLERWAILVNEFGDTGIDAAILQEPYEHGVFIREIAGGCICCAMGLPMQIVLNQLLAQSKPDRLIIELTGLGHARELLKLLSQPWYQKILELKASIVLIDGRASVIERYSSLAIFRTQLNTSDIVLINKSDISTEQDKAFVQNFVQQHTTHSTATLFSEHGAFPIEWLDSPCGYTSPTLSGNILAAEPQQNLSLPQEPELPASGFARTETHKDGYFSAGWRFSGHFRFIYSALYTLLSGANALRLKGVINTDAGCFVFNMADDCLSSLPCSLPVKESRLELISRESIDISGLHCSLMASLTPDQNTRDALSV